ELLLEVDNLSKHYEVPARMFRRTTPQAIRGLDGVSFQLHRGDTVAIVGESGSGKSTLARTLLGLTPPTGGTARYRGRDIFKLDEAERMALRRNIQAVFQDPASSLNPRMSIEDVIAEPWVIHGDTRSA